MGLRVMNVVITFRKSDVTSAFVFTWTLNIKDIAVSDDIYT